MILGLTFNTVLYDFHLIPFYVRLYYLPFICFMYLLFAHHTFQMNANSILFVPCSGKEFV